MTEPLGQNSRNPAKDTGEEMEKVRDGCNVRDGKSRMKFN